MKTYLKPLALAVLGFAALAGAKPTLAYSGGEYCREYTREITVGRQLQVGYGTACLRPDGSWEIVQESAPQPVFTETRYYPEHNYVRPYYRPAVPYTTFSLVIGDNDRRHWGHRNYHRRDNWDRWDDRWDRRDRRHDRRDDRHDRRHGHDRD